MNVFTVGCWKDENLKNWPSGELKRISQWKYRIFLAHPDWADDLILLDRFSRRSSLATYCINVYFSWINSEQNVSTYLFVRS